jgi:hypothetical protein
MSLVNIEPLGKSFLYMKGSYEWLSSNILGGGTSESILASRIQLDESIKQFYDSLNNTEINSIPKHAYKTIGMEIIHDSRILLSEASFYLSSKLR